MRPKFQADADLDARVARGLKRAVPGIDIRSAVEANLTGASDPEVLRIAAKDGRLLISQDRRTMPGHFRRFVASASSPGLILVRENLNRCCD